jgi:hypothetical protein
MTGLGAINESRATGLAAIDEGVWLVAGLVVDHDSKSIHKGLAGDAGAADRSIERKEGALLRLDVFRALWRHRNDLAADQLIAPVLLGFGPSEEFRHSHALDGGNIHGPRIAFLWRAANGPPPGRRSRGLPSCLSRLCRRRRALREASVTSGLPDSRPGHRGLR